MSTISKTLILTALALICVNRAFAETSDLQHKLLQPRSLNGYKAIRFTRSPSGHLHIQASVNGIQGVFMIDTGAPTSLVTKMGTTKFKLKNWGKRSVHFLAGGRASTTQASTGNALNIGDFTKSDFTVFVSDHDALLGALPIDGLIGGDLLTWGQAIIDYERMTLYLKDQ